MHHEGKYSLNKKEIAERIRPYGFVEISDILDFIRLICHERPDKSDYFYIRSKLDACLHMHDDHSAYFIPIRELATELDCLIGFK